MSREARKEEPARKARLSAGRKALENTATFGLLLVAVGLFAPFTGYLDLYKWLYGAGALIFTVARIIGSTNPDDSLNMRRLRRLEFWAGVAFCMGAFFWFYNERIITSEMLKMGISVMYLLRDTVYFTLAGGAIQIMAAILMARRIGKEKKKG